MGLLRTYRPIQEFMPKKDKHTDPYKSLRLYKVINCVLQNKDNIQRIYNPYEVTCHNLIRISCYEH
jgi:hypothetical protein